MRDSTATPLTPFGEACALLAECVEGPEDGKDWDSRTRAFLFRFAHSESEMYPGIAHDLETMRSALAWCVEHDFECLGDHSAKLSAARAALAGAALCSHDWSRPQGFATKKCNRCGKIEPAEVQPTDKWSEETLSPARNINDQDYAEQLKAFQDSLPKDTPQTNAVECLSWCAWRDNGDWMNSGRWVPASLARQLERELAYANEMGRTALAALTQRSATAIRDECAWLIEIKHNDYTLWWRGGNDPWANYGEPRWTQDAFKAVRFCRKEDAEVLIRSWGASVVGAFAISHLFMALPDSEGRKP